MNARRALILITALGLALAPLAAALPSGRTAEAAAAGPQAKPEAKPEAKAESAQAAPSGAPAQPAGEPAAKPAAKKPPAKRTEPILPAYQTPREKSSVIIFFVWLWLSIGVLLYFLLWWAQEADRVFRARFYEPAESPRKDDPFPPYLGE